MSDIDMLKGAVEEINALTIQGVVNWRYAVDAVSRINAVIKSLEDRVKAKEEAYKASIEDAKKRREQRLKDAAENGEKIIGGETIKINSDGTQEMLVP